MSLDNVTENAILKLLLQGSDPSWRSGSTQYLALLSLAEPDESDPMDSELDYTPYARVPLTKASAWTDEGSEFTNAALIQFAKRTDGGATQTARSFAIVDTASGAVGMAVIGSLSADLDISQNIQPQFGIGDLSVSVE